MTEDNPAAVPPQPQIAPVRTAAPNGIGGWLILPMLGLFGSIIIELIDLSSSGDIIASTSSMNAGQSATIAIEYFLRIALGLVFPIYLLVLMFNKRARFPQRYIVWLVASAIFAVADILLAYAAFSAVFDSGQVQLFDSSTIRGLLSAAVGLCVWLPYMLASVRVKNTFVK